tara:strand:+ start:1626 stop:1997 length:372 start_codon:yes stop_codon:yes gene_type:complete
VSIFKYGIEELTQKKFEPDSRYAKHDLDGDGVVSDEELRREERMIRIENSDRMADQQRRMVWVSLLSVCTGVVVILTPIVSESRLNIIIPFLQVWSITNLGIVATFMAASAWSKRNGSEKEKN